MSYVMEYEALVISVSTGASQVVMCCLVARVRAGMRRGVTDDVAGLREEGANFGHGSLVQVLQGSQL